MNCKQASRDRSSKFAGASQEKCEKFWTLPYQVAFRRKIYTSLDELQQDLDIWLEKYNNRRTHQGKRCQGRTPMATFLENLPVAKEKTSIGSEGRLAVVI
jgi:hypothetical protein